MSDKKPKPHVRFCWLCSRKLRANYYRLILNDDGRVCVVHRECMERSAYQEVKR
jgi:hypothetical protein